MKYIISIIALFTIFLPMESNANTVTGSCHDSYFIEHKMNILDTMNLLITGPKDDHNNFTCQSYDMFQTKDQEYKIDVNTEYNKVPYIIEFIGKEAPNNKGIVFIPSDVILVNYKTEQVVSHYPSSKIIGAGNVNDASLTCLVSLSKEDDDSIAVKIHFTKDK